MPYVPIRIGEKLRIVEMARANPAQAEIDEKLAEEHRIAGIAKRRRYVNGEQYEQENYRTLTEMGLNPLTDRLPEHLRLHAYSTQLGESVTFIADQLAESFEVVAEDDAVQAVIESALRLSIQLSGSGDDVDVSLEETLEEAIVAGDVPIEIRWDPVEQAVFYDLWEAEQVTISWSDRDTISKVELSELIWVFDPTVGEERQVVERSEWTMESRTSLESPDQTWLECQKAVYWDAEEEPRELIWTGFPVIPWTLLRCSKKGLRGQRGESLVSTQAMESADRYNANEQVAWLIARYNSHSNLAVTGDAAILKMEQAEHLDKDIEDILGFPGGTSVTALSLPTDPKMIEHQRTVLAEAMFSSFGLTRIEPDTIQGLGAISGYALEILNRKAEGTFRKIKRQVIRDLRSLFSLTLDVYESLILDDPDEDLDTDLVPDETDPIPGWVGYEGDMFPNRVMQIRLGSGYVVDDVIIRDDYTSGLTSRADALRARGRSNEDIEKIEDEIASELTAKTNINTGESGRFSSMRGASTVVPDRA